MALTEAIQDYLDKFNSGRFREAALHPELKEAWLKILSPLCRGLLILASAYLHFQNVNPRGARNKMERALVQFDQLPTAVPRL